MTLDQYLVTCAWLFIAFLMWFSATRREQCMLGYGCDMYWLMMKAKMKPVFWDIGFIYYVLAPSIGWSILLPIWIDSIYTLLT